MKEKRTKQIMLRFTEGEYLQLRSYHLEFAAEVPLATYARQISTGERPHPQFQNKASIMTQLLVNKLDSLDTFFHHASSVVAGAAMHLPRDQFLVQNLDEFLDLEARLRGYHYNEDTDERVSIYDESADEI